MIKMLNSSQLENVWVARPVPQITLDKITVLVAGWLMIGVFGYSVSTLVPQAVEAQGVVFEAGEGRHVHQSNAAWMSMWEQSEAVVSRTCFSTLMFAAVSLIAIPATAWGMIQAINGRIAHSWIVLGATVAAFIVTSLVYNPVS